MKKLLLVLLFVPLVSFGQSAEEFFNRGSSKYSLEDYYGAIADYTKAIELDPDDVTAYKNRSVAKEILGDLNGACADARKAASLGHSNSAEWVKNQCN